MLIKPQSGAEDIQQLKCRGQNGSCFITQLAWTRKKCLDKGSRTVCRNSLFSSDKFSGKKFLSKIFLYGSNSFEKFTLYDYIRENNFCVFSVHENIFTTKKANCSGIMDCVAGCSRVQG